MKIELDFDPFFLFKSPIKQTIMGSLLCFSNEPKALIEYVLLPDKDQLAMHVSTPLNWNDNNLTVILVHGLCGSHRSTQLVRLSYKLLGYNIRTIRLDLRGCGSGRGLAQRTYHSGSCGDIFEAVKLIKNETPNSPIIVIGYSLGGNMVLKMAGDLKEKGKDYFKKVIALSPPVDLKKSVEHFEHPKNKLFLRYFSKLLKEEIEYRKRVFEDFPKIDLPNNMTITEFNEQFIVPFFGFKDLEDYYLKASAIYVIKDIKVNTKILFSEDDPLVYPNSLTDLEEHPENIEVYSTKNGGHLGYLGNPRSKRGFYWLDSLLLDWILN